MVERAEQQAEGGTVPAGSSDVRDTGYASPRWEFDDEVTRVFDNMLERSVPQYATMRAAVTELAQRFVRQGTDVVDLGCSRGEAMDPLIKKFGARNRFVGVEVSQPMLDACRSRFAGFIRTNVVSIENLDLRTTFPAVRASVILSVLTLMFVPVEYRPRVLRHVRESLVPSGAFILVEKLLAPHPVIHDLMIDVYHSMKHSAGYSQDEIERKRFALEGVLVPQTAAANEAMLRAAGFSAVEPFWRWMNFGGWLALP